MSTARDICLALMAVAILVAAVIFGLAVSRASDDWHRATEAIAQSARHLDAGVDRLSVDAEAACERLATLPEQTAASMTAPAVSALRSLPFTKPRPTPTPPQP